MNEIYNCNGLKYTKEQAAVEWDMGWICDNCELLIHWKTKANIPLGTNKKLCYHCLEKLAERRRK